MNNCRSSSLHRKPVSHIISIEETLKNSTYAIKIIFEEIREM